MCSKRDNLWRKSRHNGERIVTLSIQLDWKFSYWNNNICILPLLRSMIYWGIILGYCYIFQNFLTWLSRHLYSRLCLSHTALWKVNGIWDIDCNTEFKVATLNLDSVKHLSVVWLSRWRPEVSHHRLGYTINSSYEKYGGNSKCAFLQHNIMIEILNISSDITLRGNIGSGNDDTNPLPVLMSTDSYIAILRHHCQIWQTKWLFLNDNVSVLVQFLFQFFHGDLIDEKSALTQVKIWRRIGNITWTGGDLAQRSHTPPLVQITWRAG